MLICNSRWCRIQIVHRVPSVIFRHMLSMNKNQCFLKLATPILWGFFFAFSALFCYMSGSDKFNTPWRTGRKCIRFDQMCHLYAGSIELILFPSAAHDCLPSSMSILSPFGFSEALVLARKVNCALWCHSWAKWIHVDSVRSSVWAKSAGKCSEVLSEFAVLHHPPTSRISPGCLESLLLGNMWD